MTNLKINLGLLSLVLAVQTLPDLVVGPPELAHHIMIVDRSGSMYGDIDALKQSIEQVLTVEEMQGNSSVKTTLISFSSHGDVTMHWKAVPISEITKLNSPYIAKLRAIRATCLTGMSQGLQLALSAVEPGEVTGITLFTDGYANDPSAYQEERNLDAFVQKAEGLNNIFLNCIGYRDWCDWPRLNKMSNALSGKTIQAKSFKDVLGVMRDTQELLSRSTRPTTVVSAVPEFLTAVQACNPIAVGVGAINVHQEKAFAQFGTIRDTNLSVTLRGMGVNDTVNTVSFAYIKNDDPASASFLRKCTLLKDESDNEKQRMIGFAIVSALNNNALSLAKDLLFASGNKTLWERHGTAVTPSDLQAFTEDAYRMMNNDPAADWEFGKNVRGKLSFDAFDAALRSQRPGAVVLDESTFFANYRYRTAGSLPGVRQADGTVTPPPSELRAKPGVEYEVTGLKMSSTEATINMSTKRSVDLVDSATKQVISTCSHVSLRDLYEFRDFTLMGSGEFNIKEMNLKINNKNAYAALKPFMAKNKTNKTFVPGQAYRFNLKLFATTTATLTDDTIVALASRYSSDMDNWITEKFLNGISKSGGSSDFTADQLQELSKICITKSLYYSPPSCERYPDKTAAVQAGDLDTYTRRKVSFGSFIGLKGDLYSGNEFLDRTYIVKVDGTEIKKPKLADFWANLGKLSIEDKPRSSRAKYSNIDDRMKVVFDNLLAQVCAIRTPEALTAWIKQTEAKISSEDMTSEASAVIFSVGCTGAVPFGTRSKMYTAEDFVSAYASNFAKAPKADDSTYFVWPNEQFFIKVTAEADYYRTGK